MCSAYAESKVISMKCSIKGKLKLGGIAVAYKGKTRIWVEEFRDDIVL